MQKEQRQILQLIEARKDACDIILVVKKAQQQTQGK